MKTRVVAWAVLIGVVWLGSKAVAGWSNPWTVPAPAVMSVLPDQPNGCGESCK